MLKVLQETPQRLFALILTPTWELAFQISEQFEALGPLTGVQCVVIVGGIDSMSQDLALAKNNNNNNKTCSNSNSWSIDNLENTKGFHFSDLKYLVMDEADRILKMDFETEVNKILKVISRDRKTGLFSATMTKKMSQSKRLGSLHKFKAKARSALLATDVASRALDTPRVDAAVDFDVPTHSEDAVHPDDQVTTLTERVPEAQRFARMELEWRDHGEKKKRWREGVIGVRNEGGIRESPGAGRPAGHMRPLSEGCHRCRLMFPRHWRVSPVFSFSSLLVTCVGRALLSITTSDYYSIIIHSLTGTSTASYCHPVNHTSTT
ncbi:Putative ATP-dependent RNA helicase DDX47 [Fukomys damarensis]|uniref:Putative ATP-dependent RNA helicase DDX47 n=1 Tax=Fukomys damarensis TaxID=885580 RepID=A0A091E726_FUKDA|nr:Putative ATP-dependent RNA helicase DDX47 [Fukomys damarensis]